MIFQSWRDFSSFMLAQILIYRSCRQYVASLTEISIHFINYLIDFESPVWTLKRLCFLGFLNLYSCWYVSILFHMTEVRSSNSFAVRFAPVGLFANTIQLSRQLRCQLRWASTQRRLIWIPTLLKMSLSTFPSRINIFLL